MKNLAYKRINITLPEKTVELLEKVAGKGSRSTFIDEAIKSQVKNLGRRNLEQELKEGAIARAERDLAIAEEWFDVENELWLR